MRALLCLLVLSDIARADTDYGLSAETWNGIGYLRDTATEARVDLSFEDELDLSTLEPEDVLLVLYPRRPLPADDLISFVESGGYVILADDFGTSLPLLEAFGVGRQPRGPQRHLALWDEQNGFFRLVPSGEHFLFFNLEDLVTNHPATFALSPSPQSAPIPILSFEGGREHLLVEADRGDGKLIALSDPSMLLNDMLKRFYGNKQLAANLLRYPCQREPCSVRVVRPDTRFTGRFDRERARLGSLPHEIAAAIALVNELLAKVSHDLAEPPFPLALYLALATLFGVLLIAFALRRRLPRLPSPSRGRSLALAEATGLARHRREADFASLARALASNGLDLARRARLDGTAQSSRAKEAYLRVASEHAGLSVNPPPRYSADRLERLHADVLVLRAAARPSHRTSRKLSQ
jgi:hypothetical protein